MDYKKLITLFCFILFFSIVVNQELAHASKNSSSTVVAKVVNSEKYVKAEGSLILRDTPNSKGKKVTMLKDDSKVFVYSTDGNGWSYVKQGNLKGYVKDSYLTTSASKNNTTKSNNAAKSNTTTKSSNKTNKVQDYGTVKGTVTWQYNKYVGTKPDVGASVYLIPTNFNHSTFKGSLELIPIGIDDGNGVIFIGEVNGHGTYEIQNVPIGEYLALIISKNTTRNPDESISSHISKPLTNLLGSTTYGNLKKFRLEFQNHTVKTIKVEKGKYVEFSKDFGYTYF